MCSTKKIILLQKHTIDFLSVRFIHFLGEAEWVNNINITWHARDGWQILLLYGMHAGLYIFVNVTSLELQKIITMVGSLLLIGDISKVTFFIICVDIVVYEMEYLWKFGKRPLIYTF